MAGKHLKLRVLVEEAPRKLIAVQYVSRYNGSQLHALFSFLYKTFKQDCPVHVSFTIDKSGQKLVVISAMLDHNHMLSKVCTSNF